MTLNGSWNVTMIYTMYLAIFYYIYADIDTLIL